MKTHIDTTYEFRPPYTGKLLRYNNGNWIDDDGQDDIAFVAKDEPYHFGVDIPYHTDIQWKYCEGMQWMRRVADHPDGNAWHYQSFSGNKTWGESYNERNRHPNVKASDLASSKCCELHGCANGRFVEFNPYDETIKAGLLRDSETKEIMLVPDSIRCIHCGTIQVEPLTPNI